MRNVLRELLKGSAPEMPSLSEKEAIIMQLLARGAEMYGLEIVSRSDGEVGRGTVYVTLGRMVDKGLISSRSEEQPIGSTALPRRLYTLTGKGSEVLHAYARAAMAFAGLAVPS